MADRHVTRVEVVAVGRFKPSCSCGWTVPRTTYVAAGRAAADHHYATFGLPTTSQGDTP